MIGLFPVLKLDMATSHVFRNVISFRFLSWFVAALLAVQ